MLEKSEPKCIGDIVSLQRGTTYQSALLGKPGPKLLGLGSIARNGGFKAGALKSYGGSCDPRILVHPGDLFVSLKDVTQSADLLGAIARVPREIEVGRLTQDTVALKFRRSDVPPDYIYWLLRTSDYREYCRAHATGTTNLGLAREDFFSYPVPPLTQQRRAIITALTALDDKIELNCQINEVLDAQASALFAHRQSKENWRERPLGTLVDIFDGPHATPKSALDGPIFLGISNLSSGMLDLSSTSHISVEEFARWTRRVQPRAGDVVFSYETRLGEAALIPPGLECCLGRRMALLRPKYAWLSPPLLLRAYLAPEFQEVVRARTIHGSTVDRLPLKEMGSFPIRLPDALVAPDC